MYRSPIRLSGLAPMLAGNEAPQRPELLLARRKLEAEFELSGEDVIQVAGETLNRQEVISLFDELQNSERLVYHVAIFRDAALMGFLETGTLPAAARWAQNPVYGLPGFLQFVSPYYAAAVNALYKDVLSGKQPFDALNTLAQNPSLMLGADSETAFRTVSRYFLDKKNALLHLLYEAKTNKSITKEEVLSAAPTADMQVLNSLPDGYEDLRYDIATALNNLCVAFDKRSLPKQSLAAIEQGARIQLEGGELLTLIPANLKLVRAKQPGLWPFRRSSRTNNNPGWRSVIFIIIIIVRLVMSFSHSSNNNIQTVPDFNTDNYTVGDLTDSASYSNQMAALLRALADSAEDISNPALIAAKNLSSESIRSLSLYKPERGAEPFQPLLRAALDPVLGVTPIEPQGSPQTDGNRIKLSNRSAWEVIIFYSGDQQHLHALYLPQKADTVLYYSGDMHLDFTAGRKWNDGAGALLLHPKRPGKAFSIYRIHGWYTQRPDNLKDFVQDDASLIAESSEASEKASRGMIVKFDSPPENPQSIRVNIDSLAEVPKRPEAATQAPSR